MKFIDSNGLEILNPNKYEISDELYEALNYFNQLVGCDKDIVITSGNRSKNSKTGKGRTSTHAKNIAADFNVPGQTHLRTANQAIESGLFEGVGWYQEGYYNKKRNEGPHVHVDLRNPKNAAVWGYDVNGNYYNWRSDGIPKLGGDLLNWSENPCGSCNK